MRHFKKKLLASMLLVSLPASVYANYYSGKTWSQVEARVSAILDNMSESQKIAFIRVDDGHMIPESDAFGIPGTIAYDSSMAVHVDGTNFGAGYPSQSALAATWNINRAKEVGQALGYETRIAGGEQMLSPVVNVYRTPFNGRAAESICGEDPYLCSVMAPSITNGIQSEGVMAGAKHLIANEQEANRHNLDVEVSERTLRELYLVPFESLVKNADIASIMCGFNKVNGYYACENHHIITDILKGEWGYQGFVVSDFNSIQDPFQGAWAGTDLDMPSGLQFTESNLDPLLASGAITQNVIDDKVKRNLRAAVRYGVDQEGYSAQTLTHPEYGLKASLDTAREGIVLLKNNGVLPLSKSAKIAVIGDMADHAPSSPLGTPYSVADSDYITEVSGLKQLNNSEGNVTFISSMSLTPKTSQWYQPDCTDGDACASGLEAEYFANTDLSGDPELERTEQGVNFSWTDLTNDTENNSRSISDFTPTVGAFSARFTGKFKPTVTGKQVFKVRADGPFKLWVDGELVMQSDGEPLASDLPDAVVKSVATKRLKAGQLYDVKLEYSRDQTFLGTLGGLEGLQMSWAALTPPKSLANYDAVVAVVGRNYENEGESIDPEFDIPDQQKIMLKKLTKLNPNTVVVMHAGGGMNMEPWNDNAGAILHAWYSGQLGGQALAEIIYGDVNPSGKLPITLDKKVKYNPSYASYSDPADYVGDDAKTTMTYSEGIYSGYRGYDKSGRKPLYPFGFGLSYTTFAFSNLSLDSSNVTANGTINATFTVTNTGGRDGYEVAQLYVKPLNASIDEPEHELKGFSKIYLKAGESKQVTLPLDARSFAYYKQSTDSWQVDAGEQFVVQVGDSSDNLPLTSTVAADSDITETTAASNPLPGPVQEAVQVDRSTALGDWNQD
ncbi:beta-glucosidase [Gallaecimonas mangrovi]|uniref:beta-glucosidase n=1 Tax=Gallaecimonas mangrovi TaxID=2291597 RepID=UPI000E201E20|nr:glycoside hydrolase family 3 C-terminal domain-containing protein [Gallaecimonas mangrovi]